MIASTTSVVVQYLPPDVAQERPVEQQHRSAPPGGGALGSHDPGARRAERRAEEKTMPGVRLAGKVAIVTGAGSRAEGIGNGRAAAVLFAREGARVLLVDQQAEAAERTLAMIHAEGGEAAVFSADVTRAGDCRAMVEEAVRRREIGRA